MENTHCGDECPYKQMGFKKCPNELESWWESSEKGSAPKLVKDCAPKRMLIMMQQLYNRMDGVQKQQGEVCGQNYRMADGLRTLAQIQLCGMATNKDLHKLQETGIIEEEQDAPTAIPDRSSR